MKIIIANSNPVYDYLKSDLVERYDVTLISEKAELHEEWLAKIDPDYIFFPHWSYIIESSIFDRYKCVVFHMTDLPFGRGGSPLQNLIVRGFSSTKISAIDVTDEIDAGDIYLKKELSLNGTAHEIFVRSQLAIKEMIKEIIEKKLSALPQKGEPVFFKRRRPSESNLKDLEDLESIYNFIRMLDSPGYPLAFLETDNFRFEFTGAQNNNESIEANVRIFKK